MAYISQMLNRQNLPGIMGGSQQPMGMPGQQQGQGFSSPQGSPGMMPQDNGMAERNGLIPRTPGEHFTDKFTESPYAPGTAHRGAGGETIYAPTSSIVQEGQNILTKTKGLKKLFDQYALTLPDLANAPEVQKSLSRGASEVEKIGEKFHLPFTKEISNLLGGNKLSQQQASIASLRAQMGPSLRAVGFNNDEINDIFSIHPGENGKNIKDRLASTWPVIERRINLYRKNLEQGVNVSKRSSSMNDVSSNNDIEAGVPLSRANPGHVLLTGPDGTTGFVPANKAKELIGTGKFKEVK